MAEAMTLKVLKSEGRSREEPAVSVIAPGGVGYLGMLRNHAPLVTTLIAGKLVWQRPSGERLTMRIGAGLLEVVKNQITILTDRVSEPQSERAERRL